MWKSYTYVPHEKMRQLSPFELDVVGSLFRNAGEKFRHKVRALACARAYAAKPALLFLRPPPLTNTHARARCAPPHPPTPARWRTTFGTLRPCSPFTWRWCGAPRRCAGKCCATTATELELVASLGVRNGLVFCFFF